MYSQECWAIQLEIQVEIYYQLKQPVFNPSSLITLLGMNGVYLGPHCPITEITSADNTPGGEAHSSHSIWPRINPALDENITVN